ncbi:CLUMA_CG011635, isoform A [Clunio marinus]|uniref:CLUMA_CG011635, isoform A n=1 Tax=Clunio marinus TaxID=568069 RepID=A0A1J1III9_9DIPT|nr:CLUMA_CG011635, isoform A [Clunio marinus]
MKEKSFLLTKSALINLDAENSISTRKLACLDIIMFATLNTSRAITPWNYRILKLSDVFHHRIQVSRWSLEKC